MMPPDTEGLTESVTAGLDANYAALVADAARWREIQEHFAGVLWLPVSCAEYAALCADRDCLVTLAEQARAVISRVSQLALICKPEPPEAAP